MLFNSECLILLKAMFVLQITYFLIITFEAIVLDILPFNVARVLYFFFEHRPKMFKKFY